jgi:hypothetical protein
LSIADFELELRSLSEGFVSSHEDGDCLYPITYEELDHLKARILVVVKEKLYDAGGYARDCYGKPIEKFEDVDVLMHYIAPIRTLRITLARREVA